MKRPDSGLAEDSLEEGSMRRVVLAVVLAVFAAGCGAAAAPSSAAPSVAPAVSSVAAPTIVPGAVTAPAVVAGSVDLTALNVDFQPKELVAQAGTVVINFHNRDAGVPHNVEINDASGTSVYKGEINTGPVDSQETMGNLAPGTYAFMCTVHPNMQGTLRVLP